MDDQQPPTDDEGSVTTLPSGDVVINAPTAVVFIYPTDESE